MSDASRKPKIKGAYYCVIECKKTGSRWVDELEFDGTKFDYREFENDFIGEDERVTHWIEDIETLLPDKCSS